MGVNRIGNLVITGAVFLRGRGPALEPVPLVVIEDGPERRRLRPPHVDEMPASGLLRVSTVQAVASSHCLFRASELSSRIGKVRTTALWPVVRIPILAPPPETRWQRLALARNID